MNEPEPAVPPPANPPPDFLLEWYKLHRAHELELNKATLAYELRLAQLLILLNGAAAGAFLTLIGAIWKEGARPSFFWIALAIIGWLIGLLAAVIHHGLAYSVQREITRAFRFRRHAEELRRIQELSRSDRIPVEPRHLGIDANITSVERAADIANATRSHAAQRSKALPYLQYVAVVFFALGSGSALMAFYSPLASPTSVSKPVSK